MTIQDERIKTFIPTYVTLSDEAAKIILREPLALYLSIKVAENYQRSYRCSIKEFCDQLQISKRIFIYEAQLSEDSSGCKFRALIRSFSFCFSSADNISSFSLVGVNKGDDYENDRAIAYSMPGFSIAADKNYPLTSLVTLFGNGYKQVYSCSSPSINMVSYQKVRDHIVSFFSKTTILHDAQQTDYITPLFRENVYDYVQNYTRLEYEIEEDIANGFDVISYDQREIVDDSAGNTTYVFHSSDFRPADDNTQNITEGSYVLVQDLDQEMRGTGGTVTSIAVIDSAKTDIYIHFTRQINDSDLPEFGRISTAPNKTAYNVRTKVLQQITNDTIQSKYMYRAFTNFKLQDRDPHLISLAEKFVEERGRNRAHGFQEKQKEAIIGSIASPDLYIIQGPPGTGKTTVITELVQYYIKNHQRVLISSQNNSAVDNVLERVGHLENIVAMRIGNKIKVSDSCQEYLPENLSDRCTSHINECVDNTVEQIDRSIEECTKAMQQLQHEVDEIYPNLINDRRMIMDFQTHIIDPVMAKMTELQQQTDVLQAKLDQENIFVKKAERFMEKYVKAGRMQKFFYLKFAGRYLDTARQAIDDVNIHDYQGKIEVLKTQKAAWNDQFNQKMAEPKIVNAVQEYKELYRHVCSAEPILCHDAAGQQKKIEISTADENHYADQVQIMKNNLSELQQIISQYMSQKQAVAEWKSYVSEKRNDAILEILLEESNVVGATCIGINSNRKFADMKFDVAILDEAGQIQVQNAIVPMTRAKKNILLGDHKQLPPIVSESMMKKVEQSDMDSSLLTKSFFEYLFTEIEASGSGDHITMLDTQFRMPPNVASVVGQWFYGGNYRTGYAMDHWKPVVTQFSSPLVVINTSDEKMQVRCEKTGEEKQGYLNQLEAKIVVQTIKNVLSSDFYVNAFNEDGTHVQPQQILGVIAPYSKQVFEIRRQLRDAKIGLDEVQINECVRTLDSFQGQERDLILFSFVRSGDSYHLTHPEAARIGFLKELRRLNVAFTRAKKQLILIGDMNYLTTCENEELDDEGNPVPYKSEKDFSAFMELLLDSIRTQNNGIQVSSHDFFQQMIGEQHDHS